MMRPSLLLAFLAISFLTCAQTDSTTSSKAVAKNFGLSFGMDYSMMRLDGGYYLMHAGQGTGTVEAINAPGLAVGVFGLVPSASLRIGLEFHMQPAALRYQNGGPNPEEHWIYPLTAELPLTWSYSPWRTKPKGRVSPLRFTGGGRVVIPVSAIHDAFPVQTPVNLNAELGIALPVRTKKAQSSYELFYSFSIFSAIDDATDDFRNRSVHYLGKDFIAVRCYFN